MRALFVYTAKIFVYDDSHYTNNLPSYIWQDRYKKVFDKVDVYARGVVANRVLESISDYDGVEFKLTQIGLHKKDLFLKRKNIYREIEGLAQNVDFIIARMGVFGLIASKIARRMGKPYTCEVVGSSWDDLWNYSILGKLAACWLQPQIKNEIRKSKFTVYVTNEYLQREYPCKGKTIGISNVILSKHDDSTLMARLNRICSMHEFSPIVLGTAAGIDVPYKGQRYVMKAMKYLLEKGIECEYRLAGNGNSHVLKSYAEKLGVINKVKFVGTLPHEKMSEFYDDLDIYIQPSLQEGLPRAVIEAMGRGLPVIGFKTAGIPELIENEFVCRRKNVKDIIDRIELLLNDKSLFISTAERNFKKSFEYEKDILEDKWYNFYSDAISSQLSL